MKSRGVTILICSFFIVNTSFSQIKVLKQGAVTTIGDVSVEIIGNYHDNSLNTLDWGWGWDFWFGANQSYSFSNFKRGDYIALYKKKGTNQNNIVILEIRGGRGRALGNLSDFSNYFEFRCSNSELSELFNHFKNTFKRENFQNKDYALSLELSDSIKIDIRRTSLMARRLAVIGVSKSKEGGYFLITERGVDLLFGRIKEK